jgi:hypothetical protein
MAIKTLSEFKDHYVVRVFHRCGKNHRVAGKVLKICPSGIKNTLDRLDIPWSRLKPVEMPAEVIPTLREREREYILETLASFRYQSNKTASALGIQNGTLTRKLKSYGMGMDPQCSWWATKEYVVDANNYTSLDDWFASRPGVVRAAYRTQVMHVVMRLAKWSPTTSS